MDENWITLIIVFGGVLVLFVIFLLYHLGFKKGFLEVESIGMEAFDTFFKDLSKIYGGN